MLKSFIENSTEQFLKMQSEFTSLEDQLFKAGYARAYEELEGGADHYQVEQALDEVGECSDYCNGYRAGILDWRALS